MQVFQIGLVIVGELREGIDGQQQLTGFLVVDVEHLDWYQGVGIQRLTQMAINELETSVGQLVGEQ